MASVLEACTGGRQVCSDIRKGGGLTERRGLRYVVKGVGKREGLPAEDTSLLGFKAGLRLLKTRVSRDTKGNARK